LSSHAFYVDISKRWNGYAGQERIHFIVGFDTFERVLDRDDRYADAITSQPPPEALKHLLLRSRLIVAARAAQVLMKYADSRAEPAEISERILY
jgi:hypothetical protein